MGEISVKTGNNARNGGKNSLNRLIRCVCGKKIGPDPRNFNQRVSLGRNDLLIRTFPKGAFRLKGEQIDGSFLLNNETYLVEAKWHSTKTGNADLHAFHGKLDQKISWARGVFISWAGFTKSGLDAWGRGKKVICVSGYDLVLMLKNNISFRMLMEEKRHCCKVSDEAAFCLIQRPYISKTLLTRRISPRGSP
ncbi:restriction endonuclease [Morganella morganii]|uniref:restriction endonuclease n=1 Tax=Morganella morganii TaxID=582 RepID=UPI003877CF43